jgi:hypothetical protein
MTKRGLLGICTAAVIAVITSSASAGVIVEDFEGYLPGPNIIQHPDLGSFLIPGSSAQYSFKSGAILIEPIPNPGSRLGGFPSIQGVVLGDWALHGPGPYGASFCFAIDCVSSELSVPSGSGYLAYNGLASHGPVSFLLPQEMSFVGAYVTGASPITLTAYDSLSNIIDTQTIGGVLEPGWRNNFISLSDTGISYVSFTGDFFVLDNLTFSAPEPSTLALFGVALAGAVGIRRRKKAG